MGKKYRARKLAFQNLGELANLYALSTWANGEDATA
jgi:hypothetical protein